MSGIYQIVNKINNKIYIGSTSGNFESRWYIHKYFLRKNKHPNIHFQSAWNKYGEENFLFEIKEEVLNPIKKILLSREQFWLDYYKSYERENGYNICIKAGNSLGFKHSKESIQKMREIQSNKILSEETKIKISQSLKGKIVSQETRQKIREANIGEKHPLSKLTWEQVRNIRKQYKEEKISQKKLSQYYRVSRRCIQNIIQNKTWRIE